MLHPFHNIIHLKPAWRLYPIAGSAEILVACNYASVKAKGTCITSIRRKKQRESYLRMPL